jgi:hypothetical protein
LGLTILLVGGVFGEKEMSRSVITAVVVLWLVQWANGQVPAQDKKATATMESFEQAHREAYGTGRTSKERMKAYYQPGSQRSYVTVEERDPKTGEWVSRKVVFNSRVQALRWAQQNGQRLSFIPLGPEQPKRLSKYE